MNNVEKANTSSGLPQQQDVEQSLVTSSGSITNDHISSNTSHPQSVGDASPDVSPQSYQAYITPSVLAPQRSKKPILLLATIAVLFLIAGVGGWLWHHKTRATHTATQNSTAKLKTATPKPRLTGGVATTLGLGSFVVGVGKDVTPGLYGISPGPQQSGNFNLTSSVGNFSVILDNIPADPYGTNTAWVTLVAGDKVQLSGDRLKTATFTPVLIAPTDPPVLSKLYNGSFNVSATDTRGIAPGKHLAYSNPGATGDILVVSKDYRIKYSQTIDHTGFMVDLAEGDRVASANLDMINFGPTQ